MNPDEQNAGTEGEVQPPSLDDLINEMVDNAMPAGDGEGDGEAAESAAGEPDTIQADDAAPETPPAEQQQQDGEQPAAPAEPDPLSPEDKAFLDSLPVKHRDAARKWRADLKRGAQEKFEAAAEARKGVEEVDQALAPFAENMRSRGITRSQLVGAMVQQLSQLNADPAGSAIMLAEHYRNSGAGPEQAGQLLRRFAQALGVQVGTGQGKPAGQADDPRDQRIAALEQQINEFRTTQEQSARQQQQAAISTAEATIQEFANAKDANGQPKHPHFAKVRATIGGLMQAAAASGERLTMEDAYQRAVWARDDLRDDLIKARQAATASATAATRRDSVARAKAATTPRTVTGSGMSPLNTGDGKLSIDQMLDRGLAEMGRA